MKKTLVLSVTIPGLVLWGCQDPLGYVGGSAPSVPVPKVIEDAAHNDGNEHFYFLPPMVPQPSYSGVFDATLAPVVRRRKGGGAYDCIVLT